MTAGQHIDYEALQQEAMRGVVRSVLVGVAKSGLVGDHYFYIAFNTQAPGVNISRRLKEKYPVEMTIVLQHRFWDLEVGDERFEVKLTFDGIPERLVVPFRTVKVFYDPSVPFGLQFEASELLPDQGRTPGMRGADDGLTTGEAMGPDGHGLDGGQHMNMRPGNADREKRRSPRRVRSDKSDEAPLPLRAKPAVAGGTDVRAHPLVASSSSKPMLTEVKPSEERARPAETSQAEASQSEAAKTEQPKPDSGGAKVVDISKFRKK